MLADRTPTPDFGAIFASAPGAYLVLDRDFRIVAANDAYLRLIATARAAILGRSVFDIFADDSDDPESDGRAGLRASLARVCTLGRADAMAIVKRDIRRPEEAGDGLETRYWRVTNHPVLDGEGSVAWVLHQGEDVTAMMTADSEGPAHDAMAREQLRMASQLKAANLDLDRERNENRALQQEKMLLASIVESSQDAIISKTLDGIVTSWNQAAERMFGYGAEEMIGEPISGLFPADLFDEEAVILDCVRRGARMEHYETRRRRKDGSEIDVALTVSPIRDPNGALVGASKIIRDVTVRKEAEDRLAELQSELIHMSRWNTVGIMASSITHDLNQPLAASSNYLAALKRVIAAPEPNLERAVDIIEKAALQSRRASDIVRQLRSFVAKGEPDRRPEDIETVVREALELAAIAVKQHDVTTEFEIEGGLPPAPVDRVQIQQVLVNLVRNAAEAMQASTVRQIMLAIRALRDEGALLVEVADTGPGLPAEIASRLFQPFATTKAGGMGLGLSICHEIVKAHGGRMDVRANHPCGTVFSLTLPLGASSATT